MMDTQRLIAFVVFSFSALLLWDAWQKHNAPKPIPAPTAANRPSVPTRPRRDHARESGRPAAAAARR
jgi:YidC/Oxa1 family membrane protein insertase